MNKHNLDQLNTVPNGVDIRSYNVVVTKQEDGESEGDLQLSYTRFKNAIAADIGNSTPTTPINYFTIIELPFLRGDMEVMPTTIGDGTFVVLPMELKGYSLVEIYARFLSVPQGIENTDFYQLGFNAVLRRNIDPTVLANVGPTDNLPFQDEYIAKLHIYGNGANQPHFCMLQPNPQNPNYATPMLVAGGEVMYLIPNIVSSTMYPKGFAVSLVFKKL